MKVIVSVALGLFCLGCSHRPTPVLDPPMSISELQKEIDPSFRLKPSKTKSEDNGWASVVEAVGLMPSPTGFRDSYDSSTRKTDSRPDSGAGLLILTSELPSDEFVKQAKRTLRLYSRSLKALDRALAKTIWDPIAYQTDLGIGPDTPPPDIWPIYGPLKDLVKAKLCEAIASLYQGNTEGAIASFRQVRRLTNRLDEMHNGYMCILVSDSFKRLAIRYAVLSLSDPHWNPQNLAKLMSIFDDWQADDLIRDTTKFELACVFLPALSQIPATFVLRPKGTNDEILVQRLIEGHPHPLDRKMTVKEACKILRDELERSIRSKGSDNNEAYRLATIGAKWPREVFDGEPMSDENIAKSRTELRSETNPLGKYIIIKEFLGPTYVAKSIYTSQALARMTKIDIAIEIYRRRFRTEPRVLADLVKRRCIGNLPIDPFSRKQFGYNPDMKLIWSVGPNRSDEGGDMGNGISFMNSSRPDLVLPSDARIWIERLRYYEENKPNPSPYLK